MEAIQKLGIDPSIVTNLVLNGDISKMSEQQKVEYYNYMSTRMGLDPAAKPFDLLKLNGKTILYCTRSGAQQLSKVHGVSHEVKNREQLGDIYLVTARASINETGRFSDSIGAVSIKGMSGDNLCNAIMKSETKAKRRATLDLLGLGILDETEIETIPNARVEISSKEVDERGRVKRKPTDMTNASQLEYKENLFVHSVDAEMKTFPSGKSTKTVEVFSVQMSDGETYSTTIKATADEAQNFLESEEQVMIGFQQTKYGLGLMDISSQPVMDSLTAEINEVFPK